MPFTVDCRIYTRPNLRSDSREMSMYIGLSHLQTMFDSMVVDDKVQSITLMFPETWLNIIEQRQLYERAARYFPNLRTLTIHTHSVYIIQCTPANSAVVVDAESRSKIDQRSQVARLYGDVEAGLFPVDQLTVLHMGNG